jgi:DtxR family Mn-dependent transcriptional regulator
MYLKKPISSTMEEYLENIYRLEEEFGVAKTKLLAELVGVSLGTVTNTTTSLEEQDLVTHEPYKGIKLTETGRSIALDVIRRHRLSERLLTDILKIEWSKVHNHSCKLEHAITSELTKSLEKALGHPETCPHGNPIPTACGGIVEEESQPLVDLDKGTKSVVTRITHEKQELLEYLMTLHLVPGSHIEVLDIAPFNGPITLKIGEQEHAISRQMASIVWVKKGE